MIPRQTVSGGLNPSSSIISCVSFKGVNALAYCSANSVVIQSFSLSFYQILNGHKEKVVCLQWCENGGKLAAASADQIIIYSPKEYDTEIECPFIWNQSWVLEHDYDVTCLSWTKSGDFILGGGRGITIWQEKKSESHVTEGYVNALTLESPGLITQAVFSPDGKHFASITKYDRFLKIWSRKEILHHNTNGSNNTNFENETPHTTENNEIKKEEKLSPHQQTEKIEFDYVYVPHPRSVLSISWRKTSELSKNNINVLLTSCRDHAIRLWLEDLNGKFHSCGVIDSALNTGSVVDWITYFPQISTLEKSSFAPTTQEKDPINATVYKMDEGNLSCDWILMIHIEGLAQIWKVEGLGEKSVPKITFWKNLGPTQHLTEPLYQVIGFSNLPHRALDQYQQQVNSVQQQNTAYDPPLNTTHFQILLFCHSVNGILSRYTVTIDPNSISISLYSRLFGHCHAITEIVKHQHLPLLASIDSTSKVIIWSSNKAYLADPSSLFVGLLLLKNEYSHIAWTTNDQILFAASLSGIIAYRIKDIHPINARSNDNIAEIGFLVNSHQRISGLLVIEMNSISNNTPNENINHNEYLVLAISKIGDKITAWKAIIQAQDSTYLLLSEIIFEMPLDENITSYCLSQNQISSPFSLATGNANGDVSMWKFIKNPTSNVILKLVGSFKAYEKSAVSSIRYDSFARIATTTSANANEISIWECESSYKFPNFVLEDSINLSVNSTNEKDLLHFEWFFMDSGNNVLSVGKGQKLCIFGQKTVTASGKWEQLVELQDPYKLSPNTSIGALSWTSDDSLIISVNDQLKVFTKWLYLPPSDLAGVGQGTLQLRTGAMQWSQPCYHPRVLMEYLLEGNFALVESIISRVADYLETIKDIDKVPGLIVNDVPTLSLNELIENTTTITQTHTSINIAKPIILSSDDSNIKQDKYADLFSYEANNPSTTTEIGEKATTVDVIDVKGSGGFTISKAKKLAIRLNSVSIKYVQPKDQMDLLGIIDTVCHFASTTSRSMDYCSVCFMLTYRKFFFMIRPLPPNLRPTQIDSSAIAWALHSTAQDIIISSCLQEFEWPLVRMLAIPTWYVNITTLREMAEKIAKRQYTKNKKAVDCILLYLALGKKSTFRAMCKASNKITPNEEDKKIDELLANDFTQEKWKTVAIKNGYVLLSKLRYEVAAAFFILGGELRDAVRICIKNLEDIQLAILLARLVEGDGSNVLQEILLQNVLPKAKQNGDCFMASTVMWLLKKHEDALTALTESSLSSPIAPTTAYYLYKHLRNHALLRNIPNFNKDRMMLHKSAYFYLCSGCTVFALKQYRALSEKEKEINIEAPKTKPTADVFSGTLDMSFFDRDDVFTPAPKVEKHIEAGPHLENENEKIMTNFSKKRAALFYITQVLNDLNIRFEDNWKIIGEGLVSSLNLLESYFAVDKISLLSHIQKFCLDRTLLIQQFVLTYYLQHNNSIENYASFMNFASRSILALSSVVVKRSLTGFQTRQIAVLSRSLLQCYVKLEENVNSLLTFDEKIQIVLAVHLGLFIRAFFTRDYKCLYALLINPLNSKAKPKVVYNNNPENSQGASSTVKIIPHFDSILAISHMILDSSDEPTIIVQSKVNYDGAVRKRAGSVENEFGESQKFIEAEKHRYLVELLDFLILSKFASITDNYIKNEIGILNVSVINHCLASQQEIVMWLEHLDKKLRVTTATKINNLQCLLDERKLFDPSTQKNIVWELLEGRTYLRDLLEETLEKIKSTSTLTGTFAQYSLKIYKDREFIRTFCFNPVNLNYCAVATAKGIKEINTSKAIFSEDPDKETLSARDRSGSGSVPEKTPKPTNSISPITSASTPKERTQSLNKPSSSGSLFAEPEVSINSPPTKKEVVAMKNKVLKNKLLQAPNKLTIPAPPNFDEKTTLTPIGAALDNEPKSSHTIKDEFKVIRDIIHNIKMPSSQHNPESTTENKSPRDKSPIPHNNNNNDEEEDDDDDFFPSTLHDNSSSSIPHELDHTDQQILSNIPISDEQKYVRAFFASLNSESKVDKAQIALCLESHPTMPFYLSGGYDGALHLWEYGQRHAMYTYKLKSNARVSKIHFNRAGSKFGVCDVSGRVSLWRFEASETFREEPFVELKCHTKRANDLAFLNSGSFLASCGISQNTKNVCLWDILLPPTKSQVHSFHCHEGGAYSMVYAPNHQLLFTGGKKGIICVFDIRQRKIIQSIHAHSTNIKAMAIDKSESFFVTGSTEGAIRIYDVNTWQLREDFPNVHEKHTFIRAAGALSPMSTYGVMQVELTDHHLYSCGADGRIIRRIKQRH